VVLDRHQRGRGTVRRQLYAAHREE
jgi:hypothetical protein